MGEDRLGQAGWLGSTHSAMGLLCFHADASEYSLTQDVPTREASCREQESESKNRLRATIPAQSETQRTTRLVEGQSRAWLRIC
jgi:hypothetical protein